ncbi:MAG TPA: class I SAM-dependent RNA methyltransferase [Anaerolineae bacterium]
MEADIIRAMGQPTIQPSNQPVTLRLDAMAYGGDAIGRVDGKAIFVHGGIAGEVVRAEIVADRGRFAQARVVEVVEASPDRVTAPCPHFGFDANACGGCHWQHIDYAAQVRFKTDIVREQLRRIGRIGAVPVRDTIPNPHPWAYRNHVQFSVTADGRPGFQAARSNRVVPVRECHIVEPPIAGWLKSAGRQEASRVEVRSSDGGMAVWKPGVGASHLRFTVKGAVFRVSAESFFQVNTWLIETLVDWVVQGLELRGGESVLDAYCGVGLFARFIAPIARRVVGIESSQSAIADARVNLGPFQNVELREGPVENELAGAGDLDAAIVDPPRSGCGPAVIEGLIAKRVRRLVYVSCDPSTLARDARQLIDSGYRLVDLQPLDMFPHTYHIECVAHFERERGSNWLQDGNQTDRFGECESGYDRNG